MSEGISDAPECKECDGHCCRGFCLYVRNDGRPWSRKRARALVEGQMADGPFQISDEPAVIQRSKENRLGYVFFAVSCTWWQEDGKCAHYDARPDACRRYPMTTLRDGVTAGYEDCPLAVRIMGEMAE